MGAHSKLYRSGLPYSLANTACCIELITPGSGLIEIHQSGWWLPTYAIGWAHTVWPYRGPRSAGTVRPHKCTVGWDGQIGILLLHDVIMPLEGTYACALVTLRCIQEGEYLTVKYTRGGYYGNSRCRCASCNPKCLPEAPRREVDLKMFMPSNAKKTRRGRRGRAKEKKRKEANGDHP